MKEEEIIEIQDGVQQEKVKEIIKKLNIAGLDFEKCCQLGVYERISNMLSLMHCLIATAYRVYGNVDCMMESIHGKKHEVNKVCKQFEKDYERFMSFWRGRYQSVSGVQEQNEESEKLFHQVMRWAQFPEDWGLGDKQHIDNDNDVMICIQLDDYLLKLRKGYIENEQLTEPVDRWAVTKLNPETSIQETVYTDIDKASAQMSAKRLSAEDTANIYTATILRTVEERRIDVLPMRAYKGGEVVGKIGKILK